jgi:hypothetical protein
MENTEFEHQSRAYANYTNYFYPKIPWTSTIYKDLYSILEESLSLTKVSLGDYFFKQFLIKLNGNLDRIEQEVNNYVQSQNYDAVQKEFIFYHKPLLENRINELIKESKNLNDLDKVDKITNQHSDTFSNNGFVLFEYLLNNHIRPKGVKGRFSDIGHYYWKMYESEIQYIHQRPEAFKRWFFKTYDQEDIGKIKTADNLKNINRDKHYSNSLEWFKILTA